MRRLVLLGMMIPHPARADILEERIFTGGRVFVPSVFTLNPASTPTNLTIFSAAHAKWDGKTSYVINPNNSRPYPL